MSDAPMDLLTASKIAKELGVSDAKVKKAITDLALSPAAKKGCCTYFTSEDVKKIATQLKK